MPLFVVLLLGATGLFAHLLFAEARARAASELELRALGRTLTLEAPEAQAKALATAFLREPITLAFDGQKLERARQEVGVSVDREALAALLRDAADPRSPLRKLHQQREGRLPLTIPMPAQLDALRAEAWVHSLAARIDTPARNARVDNAGAVTQPSAGRELDVQATLDALQDAVFQGKQQATPVVRVVLPAPASGFSRVDAKGVLGSFESERAVDDRRQQLALIARALDGALIAPGAELDFNAEVGLTRAKLQGPITAEGDRTEAAFAQVAGAIYASALFSGLPVLEQHARATPLSTMPLGLEARIDGQHDLRIRNDRSVPLVLRVSVRDGRVRAAIRGPVSEVREVELSRLVDVAAAEPELERATAGTTRTVVQRGMPSLHVSLLRRDASGQEQVERDVTYLPTPRIVKVGAAGSSKPDKRPEYLVDEQLTLTMRPGLERAELTERREGRTGTAGWTER